MANMLQSAADLIQTEMKGRSQFSVAEAAAATETRSVTAQACSLLVEQGKATRIRRGVYAILSKTKPESDSEFAARIAALVHAQSEEDALRLLQLVEHRPKDGEESELEFALAEEISRHS